MTVAKINSGFLPSFFGNLNEDLFNNSDIKLPNVAVNIKERKSDYLIELVAPGMNKEDLHVDLEGNKLSIYGEMKESFKEEGDVFTHQEFSYGEFRRSFTLPKDVDVQNIEADYTNGILQIRIPKPEKQQKVLKSIEIKGISK